MLYINLHLIQHAKKPVPFFINLRIRLLLHVMVRVACCSATLKMDEGESSRLRLVLKGRFVEINQILVLEILFLLFGKSLSLFSSFFHARKVRIINDLNHVSSVKLSDCFSRIVIYFVVLSFFE